MFSHIMIGANDIEAIKVGGSEISSGILVGSKDGKLSLNPAMQRDPKALFKRMVSVKTRNDWCR